jgi:hypothetical protein
VRYALSPYIKQIGFVFKGLNCILFKQMKGQGTYISEYVTHIFPLVEVMNLPIIAGLGRNRSTIRRRGEKKR